ncbi:MAG: NADH-ubiquinone oxidoreductase subunit NDUFA12 family protein [Candidatus Paracaedibacter sp.]
MSISIFFRTWWRGYFVGEDSQGNKYYEDKKKTRYGQPRRWVMYKSRPEASKIPATWHAWLHLTTLEPPQPHQRYEWEKDHLPNLTGTPYAHQPKGLKSPISQKDYQAWAPK